MEQPMSIEKFETYINTTLKNKLTGDKCIDTLNETIWGSIQEAEKKYGTKRKSDDKIHHDTKKLIEENKLLKRNKEANKVEPNEMKKRTTRAVGKYF